jgi:hypothetical protein
MEFDDFLSLFTGDSNDLYIVSFLAQGKLSSLYPGSSRLSKAKLDKIFESIQKPGPPSNANRPPRGRGIR